MLICWRTRCQLISTSKRASKAARPPCRASLHQHIPQIVIDLATNGTQLMPSGTLRVSLNTQSFDSEHAPTVGTVRAADYLLLEISDSGTGIELSILEHIFQPFFTTQGSTSATGLAWRLSMASSWTWAARIHCSRARRAQGVLSRSTCRARVMRPMPTSSRGDHASPRGRGERSTARRREAAREAHY